MRATAACLAVLLTLIRLLPVDTANSNIREIDFHISNERLNGMQRTVVNGQRPSFSFFF